MTITWADVQAWDPAPLDTAETALKKVRDDLLGLKDELATMGLPRRWSGPASSGARATLRTATDDLEDLVAEVAAAWKATMDAADGVRGVERAVDAAQRFAHTYELTIAADGTVTSRPDMRTYETQREADLAAEAVKGHVEECAARVSAALTKARDVDADYGAVLSGIDRNLVDGSSTDSLEGACALGVEYGDLSLLQPPAGGTPAEVSAWWDSLSEDERKEIIDAHPGWIGNLDGVDFASRDQANRNLLDDHRRSLSAERQRILDRMTPEERIAYLAGTYTGHYTDDLTRIDAKLASLAEVERLASLPDRHILGLDFTNERAQAIIGQGDLDHASHVAVFTPGLTSTVDGMGGYDNDLAKLRAVTAQQLVQDMTPAQIRAAGGYDAALQAALEDVAVVTWLDYQAPQWPTVGDLDLTVAGHDAARSGGHDLARFFQGINSSRPDDPDLTALGHSYGSTTTAYALHEHTGVDRAALFGSPGAAASSTDELRIDPRNLWSGEAAGDPVADLGRFGTDPTHLSGIQHFTTTAQSGLDGQGNQIGLDSSSGHSEYLKDRSTSQYNLANIVAGQEGDVIRGNDMDRGDLPWLGIPDTPDIPRVEIPATPQITTPDIHTPTIEGPTVDLPGGVSVDLPDLPGIDIDVPDIPSIDLPDFPGWDTPDISDLPDPRHNGGIELNPLHWFDGE